MTPLPIDIGGLFRCCIQSIEMDHNSETPTPMVEGRVQLCKYCKEPIIFEDGAWRWASAPRS